MSGIEYLSKLISKSPWPKVLSLTGSLSYSQIFHSGTHSRSGHPNFSSLKSKVGRGPRGVVAIRDGISGLRQYLLLALTRENSQTQSAPYALSPSLHSAAPRDRAPGASTRDGALDVVWVCGGLSLAVRGAVQGAPVELAGLKAF